MTWCGGNVNMEMEVMTEAVLVVEQEREMWYLRQLQFDVEAVVGMKREMSERKRGNTCDGRLQRLLTCGGGGDLHTQKEKRKNGRNKEGIVVLVFFV